MSANYQELNPISFIFRAAQIYPSRTSVIYNDRSFTWSKTLDRCKSLALALKQAGLSEGDVVGVVATNTPELYEAHFGIPMAGMVLNAINCRLDPKTIAYIIDHSQIKLLLTDKEFSTVISKALKLCNSIPIIVDIDDPYIDEGELLGDCDYEKFISIVATDFKLVEPKNEWDTISVNYTSGTTGKPKGVLYHYRGAYLNALGNALEWDMSKHPTYLWTLPMFHCNGWCFPWTIAAKVGTNVCIRKVNPSTIFNCLSQNGVTHFCGAPIILSMMMNASQHEKKAFSQTCRVMTAAAPPPAKVLEAMQKAGFEVTHVYGLTEVYGPCVICNWNEDWDDLDIGSQAKLKSRQGNAYLVQEGLRVVHADTMIDVPHDAQTIGEVLLKGNIMMKGYLGDQEATDKVFRNGWFHTGDLGVIYPDGYLQLRDRAKDIIISGGENISSIEIEDVIYLRKEIAFCGVVAKPDEKWGEVPLAFVELKPGSKISEEELIKHCRQNLANFKVPKAILFTEIPKTSTGKIQKVELRKLVR